MQSFALHNANTSRILLTFGADLHQLSWFWFVVSVTGMIIQPIVDYFSDKTWSRLGRRRSYFLAGILMILGGLSVLFIKDKVEEAV